MSTTRPRNPPTTGDVVRGALGGAALRLVECADAARGGDQAEALHQARVATRRLRSDLRTFSSLLSDGWVDGLRAELAWLAGMFGTVRDLDVLRMRLRVAIDALPNHDRQAASILLRRLDQQRDDTHAALVAALDDHRYAELTEELRIAADAPKFEVDPTKSAKPVFARLVRRAWARLEHAVAELDDNAVDESLHRVRILAKRTRYAADAAVPAWRKKARRLADAAADVQEVLGQLQDAVVTETWLRDAAREEPSAAFVAGALAADQRRAAALCREKFPRVWRKAANPRLRAWLV